MTPNVAVPRCMASTPRTRKSLEILTAENLKLFRRFCHCGIYSQPTPALLLLSGVDAAVLTYLQPLLPKPVQMPAAVPTMYTCTPTATSPESSKLRRHMLCQETAHYRKQDAFYSQLASHTQPQKTSKVSRPVIPVITVSLNHQSFLLTSLLYIESPGGEASTSSNHQEVKRSTSPGTKRTWNPDTYVYVTLT